MQKIPFKKCGTFSERKVSVDQAMKILRNNGIETNKEQAKEILDFLYLLAKMHQGEALNAPLDNIPKREIEPKIPV